MNARVDVFLLLRLGRCLLQYAAECRLNMSARAAKTIIEIEVPESGIKVIRIDPANDIPADPDALGITGGTGHLL